MIITRKSTLTGKVRQREIDVTSAQIKEWEDGELIQNAMPNISTEDREFIINGVTQDEWDEFIGEDETE